MIAGQHASGVGWRRTPLLTSPEFGTSPSLLFFPVANTVESALDADNEAERHSYDDRPPRWTCRHGEANHIGACKVLVDGDIRVISGKAAGRVAQRGCIHDTVRGKGPH